MSKYEYEDVKKNAFKYYLASISDLYDLLERHPRMSDGYDLDEWLSVLDEIFDRVEIYGK
tara:strand:+ start:547 stop:726 length:180 start_codon:yes stop_codon:yes gene_type:complete